MERAKINGDSLSGTGANYVPEINRAYDPRNYIFIVDKFIESGQLPPGLIGEDGSLMFDKDDPMIQYILQILSDGNICSRVLTSKIMALSFRDGMVSFILDVCKKISYNYNRMSGEMKKANETLSWSMMKRQEGTGALLQQLDDEYREEGFDKDFYEKLFSKSGYGDEDAWGKMCQDWQQAIRNGLKKKADEATKTRGDALKKSFDAKFESVKKQQDDLGVSDFDVLQTWSMMDGQWTETEFEKALNIVRIQKQYPEIAEVCKKMGRVANDQDKDLMKVSSGLKFKMEHASGSDIEGVTMGNDFNALLPHEVVQFSDNELEDLFYERFVTKKLQMFRYKSEMAKPSRKLNWKHASRKGPMIACVDSSASMKGVPQKIASSLLGRLETTAELLKRDCFLIDFSVNIKPIDLKVRFHEYRLNSLGLRSTEADFSKGLFPFMNGGTDATKMLEKTFELLESDPSYQNADVLWITDFLIPLPEKSLLRKMQKMRNEGTRFYGFQIGEEPNQWAPYFDHIYKVRYRIPRRF